MKFRNNISHVTSIVLLIIFFLFVFTTSIKPLTDPDTPWHLKTGEYIWLEKDIPRTDPFSFSHEPIGFVGEFILSQYWLSQLALYLVNHSFGPLGLSLLASIILTIMLFLLWLQIRARGVLVGILVLWGYAYFTLHSYLAIRPQLFTFLLITILISLLERYRDTRKTVLLLPLPFIMLLWANLHGGFIYGIVVLAFYCCPGFLVLLNKEKFGPLINETLDRHEIVRLLQASTLSVVVSLVNPNFYRAFLYAFTTHSDNLFYFVAEYRSAWSNLKMYHTRFIYVFWCLLPFLSVMLIILLKDRRITHAGLLAFSLVLALMSVRYIAPLVIIATVCLKYIALNRDLALPEKPRILISAFLIMLFSALSIMRAPEPKVVSAWNETYNYPVRAADFIRDNSLSGNILSSYNKSSFLLFRLFPQARIYADSRYISAERIQKNFQIEGFFDSPETRVNTFSRLLHESFPSTFPVNAFPDTNRKGNNTGTWKSLLENIGADIILYEAVNAYTGEIHPIVLKLVQDRDWKLVYSDGNALIFLKNNEKFKAFIHTHEKPRTFVYDEIIAEISRKKSGLRAQHYASLALAFLLKGVVTQETESLINIALSMQPDNLTAAFTKQAYDHLVHQ